MLRKVKILILIVGCVMMISCGNIKNIRSLENTEVSYDDIGINQKIVEVDIPSMHKLEVFKKVYIDGVFNEDYSQRIECLTKNKRTYDLKGGVYYPDILHPNKTNKIKLLASLRNSSGFLRIGNKWIDISKMDSKKYNYGVGVTGSFNHKLNLNEFANIFTVCYGYEKITKEYKPIDYYIYMSIDIRISLIKPNELEKHNLHKNQSGIISTYGLTEKELSEEQLSR